MLALLGLSKSEKVSELTGVHACASSAPKQRLACSDRPRLGVGAGEGWQVLAPLGLSKSEKVSELTGLPGAKQAGRSGGLLGSSVIRLLGKLRLLRGSGEGESVNDLQRMWLSSSTALAGRGQACLVRIPLLAWNMQRMEPITPQDTADCLLLARCSERNCQCH